MDTSMEVQTLVQHAHIQSSSICDMIEALMLGFGVSLEGHTINGLYLLTCTLCRWTWTTQRTIGMWYDKSLNIGFRDCPDLTLDSLWHGDLNNNITIVFGFSLFGGRTIWRPLPAYIILWYLPRWLKPPTFLTLCRIDIIHFEWLWVGLAIGGHLIDRFEKWF